MKTLDQTTATTMADDLIRMLIEHQPNFFPEAGYYGRADQKAEEFAQFRLSLIQKLIGQPDPY